MSTHTENLQKLDQDNYLQTFRRYPLVLSHGKGPRVWDVEGNEYLDVLAGIAVNNVGHCHPKVVEAIQEQAAKLIHISNFYLSEPQARLSEKLAEVSGMDRVFFSNSGAESVEGAIKVARKYAHAHGRGGEVISMTGSFHGRTMATIATGKKAMQEGFGPIPHGFKQVEFNNLEAVRNAITDETGAIILELIQGEGGINEASQEFATGLRKLCTEKGIVLIIDEIQSGMGRTGKWFAKDHYGIEADVMTSAKGLGGGVPIGAVLAKEHIADAIDYGDHGTTFGGNPLVCAASLATIEVIEEEGLLDHTTEMGHWLRNTILELNDERIKQVKGKGLMIGVEFDFETKPLVAELLNEHVLANATAGNILRLVPPLNIQKSDLEELVRKLQQALKSISQHA